MSAAVAAHAAVPRRWIVDFLLLAAIWGSSFLFMRMAAVEFGPVPTAAVRVAIAAAFLLPLLWLRGLAPQLRQHWKAVLVIGLLNSAIPFACFAFALLSITTGLSAILNATVPLFGALVAWLWLNDRLAGSRVLGLVIGFGGIALLAWDQASFKPECLGHRAGLGGAGVPAGLRVLRHCGQRHQALPERRAGAGDWPPAARSARRWRWRCRRCGSGRRARPACRRGCRWSCWAWPAPASPTCCISG